MFGGAAFGELPFASEPTVAASGIQFDAASNSGYQAASSGYSWSHTCTGSDRFLSVDISRLSVPGTTVTGITYNGVALSQIGTTPTASDAGRVDCWGLANPASGTNTIAVTLSGVCISSGTAVSYTGVNQTVPTEAYNGATATNVGAADATVTITTVADNDWVHAAIATDDGSVTAGQTSRNNVSGAGGSGANEDTGPKTPAGTQAMTYTGVAALATWTIGGYGLRPVAATSSYTMDAVAGSFTFTGTSATLLGNRKLNAVTGSFTMTGIAATLLPSRIINAATGSFALTGIAATLTPTRFINAATGSFVLTGIDASLVPGGPILIASPGSFVLTGTAASLVYGRQFNAATGSFLLTGTAATLVVGRKLNAETGSFTLTGIAATFARNKVLNAATGSFVMTGISATLLLNGVGGGGGALLLIGVDNNG